MFLKISCDYSGLGESSILTYVDILAGAVPVGEGHHDIEGGEGEHEVEEAPAVVHPVVLVVARGISLLALRHRAGLGVGQMDLGGKRESETDCC